MRYGLGWLAVVGMLVGWGVVLSGAAAGGFLAGRSGAGPVSLFAVALVGATVLAWWPIRGLALASGRVWGVSPLGAVAGAVIGVMALVGLAVPVLGGSGPDAGREWLVGAWIAVWSGALALEIARGRVGRGGGAAEGRSPSRDGRWRIRRPRGPG